MVLVDLEFANGVVIENIDLSIEAIQFYHDHGVKIFIDLIPDEVPDIPLPDDFPPDQREPEPVPEPPDQQDGDCD